MKTIPLTQGKTALISDEDYDRVTEHSWCFHKNGYAKARIDTKYVLMHRWILGAKAGQQIDHANCNRLDNRRENLRFCTTSQNRANSGTRDCNTSGYKGVDFKKEKGKFRTRVAKKFIGYYDTAKEAALAYNEAAKKLFGEFAFLNEIKE